MANNANVPIDDRLLWTTMHQLFGEARGYVGSFDIPQDVMDALSARGFIENDNRPTPAGLDFMNDMPD
ncbi:MAG: hypothetical protein ABWZ40_12240 [Caulobacterales bacterium]